MSQTRTNTPRAIAIRVSTMARGHPNDLPNSRSATWLQHPIGTEERAGNTVGSPATKTCAIQGMAGHPFPFPPRHRKSFGWPRWRHFVACLSGNQSTLWERKSAMAKQRKTGKKAAKAASEVLRSGKTGKKSKTAAGSALSQRAPKKKGK